MSSLLVLCTPCAVKLQLEYTFPVGIFERACGGCGTLVGVGIAPYHVIYERDAWPVAWGLVLGDNYGQHLHYWLMRAMDYVTGERQEICRCHAIQTVYTKIAKVEDSG